MKKLLAILFALSIIFCLGACGDMQDSNTSDTDASTVADQESVKTEIETAVKNAVKCTTEIFEVKTLSYESDAYKDNYHIVTDDDFKTYADLESFVKSTYVDTVAEKILKGEGESKTVYLDVDGKLCIDTTTVLARGYFVNWDNYSVSIKSTSEDTCTFEVDTTITEPGENVEPQEYSLTATAKKVDGKWKLETVIR